MDRAAVRNTQDVDILVRRSDLPGVKAAKNPKPIFGDYDKNKDQKIDFREYVEFVSKMSQQASKK